MLSLGVRIMCEDRHGLTEMETVFPIFLGLNTHTLSRENGGGWKSCIKALISFELRCRCIEEILFLSRFFIIKYYFLLY